MTEEDRIYFERRAERELALAARAGDPAAARSHYQLANGYLGRLSKLARLPSREIA